MASIVNRALKGFLLVFLTLSFAPARARGDIVYAWGINNFGQIGVGTSPNLFTPVAVSTLSSRVSAVAAGGLHGMAIQNGGIYTWGHNSDGQLGGGTAEDRLFPAPVSGILSTGVTAITGGHQNSLAIRNGGVYAWGYNLFGQLGDGTNNGRGDPVAISGAMSTGVTAIASGSMHSLAIKQGGVYVWGYNFYNQLGDGSGIDQTVPLALTGTLSNGVTAIAGGAYFSLAIQNGGVYAWGDNIYGQIGDGTTTQRTSPQAISGTLSSSVTAIAGGLYHSLAIKNGNVYAWGYNNKGQLGDGTTTNHLTPEQIDPSHLHNIVAIAATTAASYALSSDGSLWTWGDNRYGELGLGNTTSFFVTPQHLLPRSGYTFTSIHASSTGGYALATLAPVPEPTSLSLMGLGALAILRRRRKHRAK